MKFVYFGAFGRPYDTERYIADSLEALGHEVERVHLNTTRYEALLRKVEHPDADVLLFSKGNYRCNFEHLKEAMHKSSAIKAGWYFDLLWGTNREIAITTNPIFATDIFFSTDGGHDKEWLEHGVNHKLLRQGIFEPEAVMGTPREKFKYDVVFVGSTEHSSQLGWKHRDELLSFLHREYGDRFRVFGNDVPIRNMELNDLYASAKVVVGDSVYAPNYWSNRLYETLGRGGFLIFPEIEGIEHDFTPYRDFIPYHFFDWKGLRHKIDYYLSHDKERWEIQRSGFEWARAHHTYTQRCQTLVTELTGMIERKNSLISASSF